MVAAAVKAMALKRILLILAVTIENAFLFENSCNMKCGIK
jgi:hypothetical protein